jgi:protein-disulfide isomerase
MIFPHRTSLAAGLLGGALALGGCHPATPPRSAETANLEARVKHLEEINATYAESLAFLKQIYDQQKAQAQAEEEDEPAPGAVFAVDIAANLRAGMVQGPLDAPVTIVEAFDFACPYCRRLTDTLDDLVKHNPGKVRIVFKNMVVHPQVATPAHLASCAAAKQGKYVAFREAFWKQGFDAYAAAGDPSKIDEDNVIAIAKGVGLDPAQLQADMSSEACKEEISKDMDELAKFHVNSTPTLFVNGTQLVGALPEARFQQLVDEKLQAVKASGVPSGDYYQQVIMTKGEKQFRSKKDARHG